MTACPNQAHLPHVSHPTLVKGKRRPTAAEHLNKAASCLCFGLGDEKISFAPEQSRLSLTHEPLLLEPVAKQRTFAPQSSASAKRATEAAMIPLTLTLCGRSADPNHEGILRKARGFWKAWKLVPSHHLPTPVQGLGQLAIHEPYFVRANPCAQCAINPLQPVAGIIQQTSLARVHHCQTQESWTLYTQHF